jgi:hypothetical protein
MNDTAPLKKALLDKLLGDEYALVHVNTGTGGLDLPDHLLAQPSVTLRVSRLFRYPVELTDAEIIAELLFKGSYFTCKIPWDSVWGATSAAGEGQVWPETIPPKLMQHLLADPAPKSGGDKQSTASKNAPKHSAVAHVALKKVSSGGGESSQGDQGGDQKEPSAKISRSHLKRVK